MPVFTFSSSPLILTSGSHLEGRMVGVEGSVMWKSHRLGLFWVLFQFLPSFLYNLGGITPSQPLWLTIRGMAYISLAQGSPSTSKLALSDLHKPQCYNHTAGRYVCVYIHTYVYVYICVYIYTRVYVSIVSAQIIVCLFGLFLREILGSRSAENVCLWPLHPQILARSLAQRRTQKIHLVNE